MDGGEAMAGALRTAFNVLSDAAAPDLVIPILKQALTRLLAAEPDGRAVGGQADPVRGAPCAPAPATSQPPARRVTVRRDSSTNVAPTGDINPLKTGTATNVEPAPAGEAWGPLRDRLLTVIAARHMSRAELAAAVGMNPVTLKSSLSPRSPPLGAPNRQRLQAWLETLETNGHDRDPPAGRENGCKWIDGDPKAAGWRYCNAPTVGNSSWCAEHRAQARLREPGDHKAEAAA